MSAYELTQAEWEYACRAGTITPFNTETSISAEESNYYGHYPYEIKDNYFSQGNLTTKPGEYWQTTVPVHSFSPNQWGLYNMHGKVGEWVWDYYGAYDSTKESAVGAEEQTDPTRAETGTLRVYRGGGWNDFAKNMRSVYRAALAGEKGNGRDFKWKIHEGNGDALPGFERTGTGKGRNTSL